MATKKTIPLDQFINYIKSLPANDPINLYQITQHFNPTSNSRYELDIQDKKLNFLADLIELSQSFLDFSLMVGKTSELPKSMPKLKLVIQPNQEIIWFGQYLYHPNANSRGHRYLTQKAAKAHQKVTNQSYLRSLKNHLITNQKATYLHI